MYPIAIIAQWCSGVVAAQASDSLPVSELAIDTRRIALPEETLFIAITTPRRDGHQYIGDAYVKGVRHFLIQSPVDYNLYPEADFVLVKDTVVALQAVAAQHRRQYAIPVIGITGSNGKTIVKEWLYQSLEAKYNAVRSPKSYNSQLGVPMSVWLLGAEHQLGIFEAGISQPGEMEKLERIIQPTIGVFTNTGEAHSEGFMNLRQKVNEKLLLFRHAEKLVYCRDYPELHECVLQYHRQRRDHEQALELFTWSLKSDADLRVINLLREGGKTEITAQYKEETITVTIPFTDAASVENALHCWSLMLLLGLDAGYIKQQLAALQPVAMRLELRHGINDCTIINDAYNSDLTSFSIALDFLEQQRQHPQRTVILSDMLQMARGDADLYEEVAALMSRRSVQRFIGIGPALYKHKAAFRKYRRLRSFFFKTTADFLRQFHLITFQHEAILLKGARSFEFEQISQLLEQEIHQTILTINLSALQHNLDVFRNRIGSGVKLMAMVKAFSYGAGSYEIANALQYAGVDYLSVAYTDEGVTLRKAGITAPIMVMSPDSIAFDRMIAWKLEPEIFNLRSLHAFTAMAQTLGVTRYPIHIKLDTGMHRLGFMPEEIDSLLTSLVTNEQVHVASVFSHLAGSEDKALDGFTAQQATAFESMSGRITAALGYQPLRHLSNTAGIARHANLYYDMVRLGLGLYGIDSSGAIQQELRQISTLRTAIVQIKELQPGETVGYGRRGHANTAMRIATIAIGYADGYPRALGHGAAHVLIHGQPAPTVGVICMDMCMVDITHIPEAQEGDTATIFSPELPFTQLAQWADTIPYELMTGISQRVKRVYVNEG